MKPPSFALRNEQRRVKVNTRALAQFGQHALAVAFALRQKGAEISALAVINIALVSDARMTQWHAQFSQIKTATDVLTFQHGDIAISVETAQRQARTFGHTLIHELKLYLVHGLLHLCGFDDRSAPARAKMRQMEKRVLARCEKRRRI